MGMVSEFKEFAIKGNVMDMAVGLIIGGAFGKIVSSLVNDLLMPVVGLFTGGVDFTERFHALTEWTTRRLRRLKKPAPPCLPTARLSRTSSTS